jgi:hypothetical protein
MYGESVVKPSAILHLGTRCRYVSISATILCIRVSTASHFVTDISRPFDWNLQNYCICWEALLLSKRDTFRPEVTSFRFGGRKRIMWQAVTDRYCGLVPAAWMLAVGLINYNVKCYSITRLSWIFRISVNGLREAWTKLCELNWLRITSIFNDYGSRFFLWYCRFMALFLSFQIFISLHLNYLTS